MKKRIWLIFIIIGVVILLVPVWMHIEGMRNQQELERKWQQFTETRQLKTVEQKPMNADENTEQNHPVITETPYEPVDYEPIMIGKLTIPKIGLKAVIVEGVDPSELRHGPGHIPGTAMPGEPGNCGIAGHRNMYGSWFKKLNKLKEGDTVLVDTLDDQYSYSVTKVFKVQQADVSVLDQSPGNMLTLVTCMSVPGSAHRLIVAAEMDMIDN